MKKKTLTNPNSKDHIKILNEYEILKSNQDDLSMMNKFEDYYNENNDQNQGDQITKSTLINLKKKTVPFNHYFIDDQ